MIVTIDFHVSNPTLVTIRRTSGPQHGWAAIAGLLAEHVVSSAEGVMVVALEGFIASLSALATVAVRYGVSLQFGPKMERLLNRLAQETTTRKKVEQGLISAPSLDEVASELLTTRFTRQLRPFQYRDLGHLLALPHGANFSVPGAGKTTVAYGLYELLRSRGCVEQLLVVAPLSAFSAWKDEATACFSPGPTVGVFVDEVPGNCEVLLVNYHRLASNYSSLSNWVSPKRTHLILDEAHRIKRGRLGVHGTAVLDLSIHAVRRDVLTGTPAPQSIRDLETLFDFLWPGQGSHIIPKGIDKEETDEQTVDMVSRRIAPLYVRTNKQELDLPEAEFRIKRVPMGPLQRAFYQALKGELVGKFQLNTRDRQRLRELGRVVMYLIEAATNPLLVPAGSTEEDLPMFQHPPLEIDPESNLASLFRQYHLYETPSKIMECSRIVRDVADSGGKVLLWTTFRRNIGMLEKLFSDLEPALIHGGIHPEDGAPSGVVRTREAEIARFHEDDRCKILIANPAACAEGVSLHRACHHAVFLDRTFNAGQFLQALDRIHRLGLPKHQTTTFTILLSEGTIDEVIEDRVNEKVRRLGRLLNDPQLSVLALPTEEDGSDMLDEQDLTAILEHVSDVKQ